MQNQESGQEFSRKKSGFELINQDFQNKGIVHQTCTLFRNKNQERSNRIHYLVHSYSGSDLRSLSESDAQVKLTQKTNVEPTRTDKLN